MGVWGAGAGRARWAGQERRGAGGGDAGRGGGRPPAIDRLGCRSIIARRETSVALGHPPKARQASLAPMSRAGPQIPQPHSGISGFQSSSKAPSGGTGTPRPLPNAVARLPGFYLPKAGLYPSILSAPPSPHLGLDPRCLLSLTPNFSSTHEVLNKCSLNRGSPSATAGAGGAGARLNADPAPREAARPSGESAHRSAPTPLPRWVAALGEHGPVPARALAPHARHVPTRRLGPDLPAFPKTPAPAQACPVPRTPVPGEAGQRGPGAPEEKPGKPDSWRTFWTWNMVPTHNDSTGLGPGQGLGSRPSLGSGPPHSNPEFLSHLQASRLSPPPGGLLASTTPSQVDGVPFGCPCPALYPNYTSCSGLPRA